MEDRIHVLMTGGGTLGPVTPLIAIADAWKEQNGTVHVSWIGTPNGPERDVIEARHETFFELSAPKLSRHEWWKWPIIGPLFLVSLMRAYMLLKDIQPSIVFTAGGYVSVPVVMMAKLMKIPTWVHQLDVVPGVANKMMVPFATRVSVTWQESEDDFPKGKTRVVGGMLRPEVLEGDADAIKTKYGLDAAKKTIFVLGGGTGAAQINDAMAHIGRELLEVANVIHLTGKGKMLIGLEEMGEGYVAKEFMDEEMKDAYAAADLVVARAGMGTIFEIAGLKKPTIFIPIEGSHQEKNAAIMEEREGARVIWKLTPQLLKQEITKLLENDEVRMELGEAAHRAVSFRGTTRILEEAKQLLQQKTAE